MTKETLENNYTYHAPTEAKVKFYTEFRSRAKDLATYINDNAPESREKSLALTKLEEVVMWGNAAAARN